MHNVNDYAKYFLKRGLDSKPNTFDGNMKLQKLLFFSNIINYSETGTFLFNEKMLAFKGGTVIDEVRKRYQYEYSDFKKDSLTFEPNFTDTEYESLNLAIELFGNVSAKELSKLNHEFDFWKKRYQNSICSGGYHDQEKAVITEEDVQHEHYKIKKVITVFKNNSETNLSEELINGVKFYYDPSNVNLNEIMNYLESFSISSDEDSYTLFYDEEELVIM
ncbi:MAG: DUF4065 domain-containing protein [Enterococcus casseliflavus]|uniref:Panacea domain-containing protein n=1 Tax=Enterococcus casseliflavus TaxID=37734 RepID=UPI000E4E8284|nr:type II toxin-antitoxin system antitoxin SocA domain-containing protein [Enterococcus casseliflavus]MBS5816151.1 DUF4065 domain-containing protein [Enterococcus casseliflavus]MDU3348820.1 DUF4065 domain-containing protein [Clostridium sp.]RHH55523.1 DUF4065 domain-containing protein [Enterococcus casseliflavus]